MKVQRPDIAEVMERDIAALSLVAEVAQERTSFGQSIRTGEILDQFARSLRSELDFQREAAAMEEMATLVGPSGDVRVPSIYRDLCTRRLLVQERFEGMTVADAEKLGRGTGDRRQLADRLLRSMLDQVLKYGFFHADPHPGNVFVLSDGSLGLIDFGAVGRLDSIEQAAIVDMLVAIARRDIPPATRERGARRRRQRARRARASWSERSRGCWRTTSAPIGAVDPTIMQDLVSTISAFGVRLPGDLVLLSRALATLDGTLRVMCPGMSLVAAATEAMISARARRSIATPW